MSPLPRLQVFSLMSVHIGSQNEARSQRAVVPTRQTLSPPPFCTSNRSPTCRPERCQQQFLDREQRLQESPNSKINTCHLNIIKFETKKRKYTGMLQKIKSSFRSIHFNGNVVSLYSNGFLLNQPQPRARIATFFPRIGRPTSYKLNFFFTFFLNHNEAKSRASEHKCYALSTPTAVGVGCYVVNGLF